MATSRLCSIPDCGKPHYGHGWCSAHYQRWLRNKDPLAGRIAPKPQPPECTVAGCLKKPVARGLCSAHYERFKVHGDPLRGRVFNGEALRYFQEVVVNVDSSECLLWPYNVDGKGYGRVRIDGGLSAPVHRLACEHVNGPAPSPNHEAAHNCGNRRCVNPTHIRWATTRENNADKLMHDTHNRGARNGMAKLSEDNVRLIKRMLAKGMLHRDIAAKMGIHKGTVSDISRGHRWGWLE